MDLGWSDVQTTNLQGVEKNTSKVMDNGKKMKITTLSMEYFINK